MPGLIQVEGKFHRELWQTLFRLPNRAIVAPFRNDWDNRFTLIRNDWDKRFTLASILIVAERWWKLSAQWGLGRHVVGFMGSFLVLRQEWLQVFEESFKTSLHVGFT